MGSALYVILFGLLVQISFQKETVKLTVFYESYCPDSINFFEEQLGPVWKKYGDSINLDLVPYGFASQTYSHGHWHFTCQHGEKECIGNIIHACTIHQLVTSHQQQFTKLVNFINCLMNKADQEKSSKECSVKNKIKYDPIKKCEKSKMGENLLSGYGNRTNSFTPALTWVPTAVFNDVFNQKDQDQAMDDLEGVVCKYIPNHKHCST